MVTEQEPKLFEVSKFREPEGEQARNQTPFSQISERHAERVAIHFLQIVFPLLALKNSLFQMPASREPGSPSYKSAPWSELNEERKDRVSHIPKPV
jgi:hypothetical protein